jgi:two-component system cell cycle response regulator DivK
MADILIVDDDRINLALIHSILEQQGHAIAEAGNGEEALSNALQSPPDLIVMDIMMPGMGGVEALHRLRKKKSTQHIPVIALTAMAMPGDENDLLESGFDAYISKPLRVPEFIRQVEELLVSGMRHD